MTVRDPGHTAGVLRVCGVARVIVGYATGMSKVMAAGAFATGYVLGARAGRERYEQIRRAFAAVAGDPRVQEVVTKVEDRALNLYNDKPSTNGSAPRPEGVAT